MTSKRYIVALAIASAASLTAPDKSSGLDLPPLRERDRTRGLLLLDPRPPRLPKERRRIQKLWGKRP